jgi:phage terminase large subunit-like protein
MAALATLTAAYPAGYRGFLSLCAELGEPLEPHQRKIARAVIDGPEHEVGAVLPRGNAKSTTAALIAVHHVVSTPNPSVYVGAGSREQARVIGRIVERLARKPAIQELGIETRTDELRIGLRETVLQVVPADGARAHGWERPTLLIADELWMWSEREPTLLGAMLTALVKNPEARFLAISTSSAQLDSQLGRLRARALAQPHVVTRGAFTDARGDGLRWLEWSLPDGASLDDARAVKSCNPAPWITIGGLRDQRRRVTEIEYAQFHACRWGVGEGAWLPHGAWAACRGEIDHTPREVVIGIDIGGTRAASAVVGVTPDLQVPICEVFQGDDAVLAVTDAVLALKEAGWVIRELAYDPWRYEAEALRLQREHGLVVAAFPQSHARMTVASEGLHSAVVEGRLRHPGHPDLDRHVAAAVARKTGRGWRLDKIARDAQIDAAIALAMAVERAQFRPEPVQLLGWLGKDGFEAA